MKKYLVLAFILLCSAMANGKEVKLNAEAEAACKAFKTVQTELAQVEEVNLDHKSFVISAATAAVAVRGIQMSIDNQFINDSKKYNVNETAVDVRLGLQPPENLQMVEQEYKKKQIENLKKGLKSILKYSGVGTIVFIGVDAYQGRSLNQTFKEIVDEFAPPVGDSSMTAYYVQNPEKFFKLSQQEACVHLAGDEVSKTSSKLRDMTLELYQFFKMNAKNSPTEAVSSDQRQQNKSEISEQDPSHKMTNGSEVKAE